MKAKLIKNELPSGYFLYDKKGDLIASTIKGYKKQPLSLKNCEAIERGYDLDELAEKRFGKSLHHASNRHSFREGFKKALELLGDKKFSESDMMNIYILGGKYKVQQPHSFLEKGNEIIQSLQQTEWEVEIVMEYYDPLPPTRQTSLRSKLDADGCLILKRK